MGVVKEGKQSFEGWIDHLPSTFQSNKTDHYLIAEFFSLTQKNKERDGAFTDKLQVLVHKVICTNPPNFFSEGTVISPFVSACHSLSY